MRQYSPRNARPTGLGSARAWERARGWARECKTGSIRKTKPPGGVLPSGGLSYLGLAVSVIEPQQHPHRPGLVCQVSDTRAQPALTVESQERGLVKRIVQVYRQLPTLTRQTGVQVEETVRGQQRVESEDPLRQRAADRVGSEGVEVHAAEFLTGAGGTDSGALIVDQRVARAHVLIGARHERPRPGAYRPAVGGGGASLEPRHAGEAIALRNSRDHVATLISESGQQLGIVQAAGK